MTRQTRSARSGPVAAAAAAAVSSATPTEGPTARSDFLAKDVESDTGAQGGGGGGVAQPTTPNKGKEKESSKRSRADASLDSSKSPSTSKVAKSNASGSTAGASTRSPKANAGASSADTGSPSPSASPQGKSRGSSKSSVRSPSSKKAPRGGGMSHAAAATAAAADLVEQGPSAEEFFAQGAALSTPSDVGPSEQSVAPGAGLPEIPDEVGAGSSSIADLDVETESDSSGSSAGATQPLTLTSTISRGTYHQCGTARRVKVYELQGETWYDRGTGYCAGVYDEDLDEALLVARKEERCQILEGVTMPMPEREEGQVDLPPEAQGDRPAGIQSLESGPPPHYVVVVSDSLESEDVLLKTKVVREDVYQKQQDTLVVWTEPNGVDMALSFQEAEGCHEVWEFLTEVQKHFMINSEDMLSDSPPSTPNPGSPSGALGMSGSGAGPDGLAGMGQPFTLPDPEFGNLEEVEVALKEAATKGPNAREKVAEWLLKEEYIKKLLPVFSDAEDLEALPSLHLLCVITQTILMLNDNVIFEYILQDDVFLGVVGMLEYDPEFPRLKASYRDYLSDPTRFRQVVEISDPTILAKIHQTYRLLYLKDVILARVLDDPTFSILNSFIFFHQVDIVNYCSTNEAFLHRLFIIFDENGNEPEERKHEAVIFLQQLCAMGKNIQLPARMALYRTLTDWGLLNVAEFALNREQQNLRNAAAEILMTIIEYDANSVRMHVLNQVEQKRLPLVITLTDLLHNKSDLGLKTQMAEAMRVLFDNPPENPNQTFAAAQRAKGDPDRFLTWFYEAGVEHLFRPFNDLPDFRELPRGMPLHLQNRERSALFGHLCDLLCYVVLHHSFRSQYFVLTSEISRRVGSLLRCREKHIRLAALRFFRACLGINNQFTNRHFIKIELFGAILDLVEKETERDNLVSSACLDFFEHLRKENMKPLINHLADRYGPRMRTLAESPNVGKCFAALILLWERNNEPPPPEPSQEVEEAEEKSRRTRDAARRGGNRATMDSDEESYFNASDEDEDVPGPSSADVSAPPSGSSTQNKRAKRSVTSRAAGLVPYGDDDGDGEEFIPITAVEARPSGDPNSNSVASTSVSSAEKESAAAGATMSPSPSSSEPSPSSPPRLSEKRRREEEEEEEDMMGRLATKRRSEEEEEEADQGGFVRASSALGMGMGKGKSVSGAGAGSPGSRAGGGASISQEGFNKAGSPPGGSGSGGGAKKISLSLSKSSIKIAGAAEPNPNSSWPFSSPSSQSQLPPSSSPSSSLPSSSCSSVPANASPKTRTDLGNSPAATLSPSLSATSNIPGAPPPTPASESEQTPNPTAIPAPTQSAIATLGANLDPNEVLNDRG